jgi:hypothetical protein
MRGVAIRFVCPAKSWSIFATWLPGEVQLCDSLEFQASFGGPAHAIDVCPDTPQSGRSRQRVNGRRAWHTRLGAITRGEGWKRTRDAPGQFACLVTRRSDQQQPGRCGSQPPRIDRATPPADPGAPGSLQR